MRARTATHARLARRLATCLAVTLLAAAAAVVVPSAAVADAGVYPTFYGTFTSGGPLGNNVYAPGAGEHVA